MLSLLKRWFRGASHKDNSKLLIQNGNLKVGEGTKLTGMDINILGAQKGFLNVEIGADCYLMGSITIYSNKARVKIGDRVFIGPNTTIFCYDGVEIQDDVMFSWGCTIIDTNSHSLKSGERMNDVIDWKKGWQYKDWSVVESGKILVEKKSWIGFNSILMKGLTIGEGSIVAAGSVVTKSTEPYSVVGGNPATFIKKTS